MRFPSDSVRARLHQSSATTLRWRLRFCSHRNKWSRSKMGCKPILEQLHCFQWERNRRRHRRVVTALTLTLGVNGHLVPPLATLYTKIITKSLRAMWQVRSARRGFLHLWPTPSVPSNNKLCLQEGVLAHFSSEILALTPENFRYGHLHVTYILKLVSMAIDPSVVTWWLFRI